MRRRVVSASPSGPHIANRGKYHLSTTAQLTRASLIHIFPQAQARMPVRQRVPLHLNRATRPPSPLLPPSAHRPYRPRHNERNVGLSGRRRSASTSSEPTLMSLSSRLTVSSAPAVTNGSGCVATLATAPSRGRHIARAAWPRRGAISRYFKIFLPFHLFFQCSKTSSQGRNRPQAVRELRKLGCHR